MSKTKFFKGLFIAGIASLAFGATAMAQSTILTIDQARVMRDSEVGKHILRQMESIAKSMESELKASKIVSERKADIILDRSLVIYGGKTSDVTDTAISRLNTQMRTVSVVRERLPRKAAPK